jgi:monooxygenase
MHISYTSQSLDFFFLFFFFKTACNIFNIFLFFAPQCVNQTTIDGKPYKASEHILYRTLMLSNVPNMAFTFGYVNASWTLKADLISMFVARLLNKMKQDNARIVTPIPGKNVVQLQDMPLSSNYMTREKNLPGYGDRGPWKVQLNFISDRLNFEWARLTEDLVYTK